MAVHILIPARMGSTRLPNKALVDIKGLPLVIRTYQQASKAKNISSVVIATDHKDIISAANEHNAKAIMTSEHHKSGTERLSEVVCNDLENYKDDDIIINVQGDEPFIPVKNIEQVAENLQSVINKDIYKPEVAVATLCSEIKDLSEIKNPNAVKVVFDNNNLALYFSRAPVPYARDFFPNKYPDNSYKAYRHIGLYAYSCKFLRNYKDLIDNNALSTHSGISDWESLEQLKVMSSGYRIHVDIAKEVSLPGIDTEEDLLLARG